MGERLLIQNSEPEEREGEKKHHTADTEFSDPGLLWRVG
jgi:hypothetical protein